MLSHEAPWGTPRGRSRSALLAGVSCESESLGIKKGQAALEVRMACPVVCKCPVGQLLLENYLPL